MSEPFLHPAAPVTKPGAYRWYYADVTAGPVHAVAIFMIGSVFSARYSTSQLRGALPEQHSAVNFAVYDGHTRKTWVLSEYGRAVVDGSLLCIGRSRLSLSRSGALFEIDDADARSDERATARLRLVPLASGAPSQLLEHDGAHCWEPLMPRAIGELDVPRLSIRTSGFGYVDTNHGSARLGTSLPSWRWSRVHTDDATFVSYELPSGRTVEVRAESGVTSVHEASSSQPTSTRMSGWGLRIPATVQLGGRKLEHRALLESSPFYARYLAQGEGLTALGEVADFRRFHSPLIRWMANYRTRMAGAA